MSRILTVKLPWPPTINHYWRTVPMGRATRTLISKKGRIYRTSVIAALSSCGFYGLRLDDRLAVTITLYPPTKARRDLDNFAKALLDAFTHAGVWLDDDQIDALHIYRGAVEKGGNAVVTVHSVEE